MRQLTKSEHDLISSIANALPSNISGSLKADLELATVVEESPDRSRVKFELSGYTRPAYRGQHIFPAEGKMLDKDGAVLDVLLYADENERLFELEVIRWGGDQLLGPKYESFRVL